MATNDLILYKKTEELLYKTYPKLVNYPKYERYALSQTIKNCFFSLLQNIALGNSVKTKRKSYLQEADGYLEKEKAEQVFNGWYGHSKHANSFNFIRSLISKNDYVYIDNKNVIRVKEVK